MSAMGRMGGGTAGTLAQPALCFRGGRMTGSIGRVELCLVYVWGSMCGVVHVLW